MRFLEAVLAWNLLGRSESASDGPTSAAVQERQVFANNSAFGRYQAGAV